MHTRPRHVAPLVAALVTLVGLTTLAVPAQAVGSPADRYGRQAFREANEKRTARDLAALARDACLQDAAVAHAQEMARRSRIFEPALRPIRRDCELRGVAANAAGGYEDGDQAVRAWMRVTDDREDLLRPRTALVGSAARRNDKGTWYVVQLYGARRPPAAAPTPTTARGAADRYGTVAFRRTNARREGHDLRALDRSRCVQRFAERQARTMARKDEMFHQDLGPILNRCDLSSVGENVAAGYPDGAAVVRGWMGSEGHRANILNPGYDVLGVAAHRSDDGTWYAAQVFGGQ